MFQAQCFVFQFLFALFFKLKILFHFRQGADVCEHVLEHIMPGVRVGGRNFGEGFIVKDGRVEVEVFHQFPFFVFALVVNCVSPGKMLQRVLFIGHHIVLHHGGHVAE